MKILPALLLLVLAAAPSFAQLLPHQRSQGPALDLPFSIGGYLQLGAQSPNPGDTTPSEIGTIGLYGELNRGHFHPGLDLRGTFTNSNVGGTLVGPRFAVSYSALRPYVAFLIGPNHVLRNGQSIEGINSSFVTGLDLDYGTNFRWRLLEFSQGAFTGIAGSRPQTLSGGIVIVFP